MLDQLKSRFTKKQLEIFTFAGVGIVILIGVGIFLLSVRSSHKAEKQINAPAVVQNQDINQDFRFIPKGYSGQQTVQDEAVKISALEKQVADLADRLSKKEKGDSSPNNSQAQQNPLPPTIPIPAPAISAPQITATNIEPSVIDNSKGPNNKPPSTTPSLGVLKALYKDEAVASKARPKFIIPMGSVFKAIPLGGFIALPDSSGIGSTGAGIGGGSSSTSNARYGSPFSARIKGVTYLPNSNRVDLLNDCHVIAGGVANISAGRVDVNAYAIRCTDADGQIYGAEVADPQLSSGNQLSPGNTAQQPFAVGWDEDGIRGLQATVVVRSSTALQKEFLAGFIGNLGAALAPQQVQGFNSNFTGGQAQYQTPNASYLAGSSLGAGISQSANMLAKQYAEYANAIKPAMEVRSGLVVTFQTMRDIAIIPLTPKN